MYNYPSTFRIEDFIMSMKYFIEVVKLDAEVLEDCKNLIDDFQLALTLYNKFNEIWKKLGIKDKYLNKDCEGKIKNFAWLIFITAKSKSLILFDYILEKLLAFPLNPLLFL